MTEDLFSELQLRDVTIPNRVMVSPMCQHSTDGDGLATDWHLVHLGSRAVGGAGLVSTEATAVQPRGRISPGDLGIWSDEHTRAVEPVARFIKRHGSVPAMQLAHAGRKGSKHRPWHESTVLPASEGGWETYAPSDRPYPYAESDPPATRAMDRGDIDEVVRDFADGAARADEAGFEVVEIHAAHGYLIHEFLSPATNDRDDDYGGSFEDRTRLLREIAAAVREVWPDGKPLFVRISATDWLPDRDSWTLDQSTRLARHLSEVGVDLLDVSAGGLHPDQQIPATGPSYQLPFAEHIRAETDDLRVGSVGGIVDPVQADEIIRNDRADLTIIGREHLRDPYFTLHGAAELGESDRVDHPRQYDRAF